MSEVSSLKKLKFELATIAKLEKIVKKANVDDMTTMLLLKRAIGEMGFSSYPLHQIWYNKDSVHTVSISGDIYPTILTMTTVGIAEDNARDIRHLDLTNSKKEKSRRINRAIKTLLNHPVEKGDRIFDLVILIFKAIAQMDCVVTEIKQTVVYDHFGSSDSVNETQVFMMTPDCQTLLVSMRC